MTTFEPKSSIWQSCTEKRPETGPIKLFDPTARAGWHCFQLPKDHFLTHAAMLHDPGYETAGTRCERSEEDRAEWDVRFFRIGAIDAQKHQPDWRTQAERLEDLCWAYLAVRSGMGKLAYWTGC